MMCKRVVWSAIRSIESRVDPSPVSLSAIEVQSDRNTGSNGGKVGRRKEADYEKSRQHLLSNGN